MMIDKGFTRVSDILPGVLRRLGMQEKMEEREILSVWGELVGEELAARTRPLKLSRGILHVYVEHGAWMQEIRFMEKEILGRLRARVPGARIERIRFTGSMADRKRGA